MITLVLQTDNMTANLDRFQDVAWIICILTKQKFKFYTIRIP